MGKPLDFGDSYPILTMEDGTFLGFCEFAVVMRGMFSAVLLVLMMFGESCQTSLDGHGWLSDAYVRGRGNHQKGWHVSALKKLASCQYWSEGIKRRIEGFIEHANYIYNINVIINTGNLANNKRDMNQQLM